MDVEAGLELADALVFAQTGQHLNDELQRAIFRGSWQGNTYAEIADSYPCNESHAKEVGSKLWEILSAALGETVGKKTFKAALERYWRSHSTKASTTLRNVASQETEGEVREAVSNSNFVGREGAIAHLNTLVNRAKIIVIQAAGGVGKTTLAQEYLKSQGFLVLYLPMAKEKESITAVESVVEEWLKRDFEEEPGREFGVMLTRLKRQLQNRRVGVLIDNLEPALDKQGRFIEPHRRYVELLRVLGDSTVQSVTLITSRDRLCDDGVNVEHYQLPGLDEQAWQQFFSDRHINIDTPTLKAMHNAYGGNAKAMDIFCGAIRQEFDGDMAAYWQENSADLLVKPDLKNLVTNQFNRLQEIDFQAYQLLCRLGCYRYQDVPTVPTEGLLCLLWDVEEARRRSIIESLRNRSLVEFHKREYWLHPMIREEAIARLRASENWDKTNRIAAEFWTESVKTIETVKDALTALEAYYHYLEISDFGQACFVILSRRDSRWRSLSEGGETLDASFYRLSLYQQIIFVCNVIIDKFEPSYLLGRIYDVLSITHEIIGDINKAMTYGIKLHKIAKTLNFKDLHADALKAIGRCKLSLWELDEAIIMFESSASIFEEIDVQRSATVAYYYLAFLKTIINSQPDPEVYILLEKAYEGLSKSDLSIWRKGYGFLFLGLTYSKLGKFKKSFEMYRQGFEYAKDSNFTHLLGKIITGIAELYREQGDFETAIANHSESIELLDKIGAKCDLAEAYYQLGLTYQKIGDTEKSQDNFAKAIRLFSEMEAPKQVEKVRRAMENRG
ncbi:MAG TPA: hypothetical protein DDW76_32755 [Cyanobacteria bacterium UBA11369]|nr:hypothetical protein [Cyanobacteria bacterium UBA11371]HBE31919.1 hypothetical protein [Cyanobacteria bacterium UBA11368]HBE53399.1 hypothetical protein [Cyanobacteria bacterium UBA11369]